MDNANVMMGAPTCENPVYTESEVRSIIDREVCRNNEELKRLTVINEELKAKNDALVDAICVLASVSKRGIR